MQGKRGRKSVAETELRIVGGTDNRISPPTWMPDSSARLSRQIISVTPPGHFVPSDAELLASYCAASVLARNALQAGDIAAWEKGTRMLAILATKLRLAPQSRLKAEAVHRNTAGFLPSAYDQYVAARTQDADAE